jgi:hypothetical protein
VGEHYWVESAPGYVRLRHELGTQGRLRSSWSYGDGRTAELVEAAREQGLISLVPWASEDDIEGRALEPNVHDDEDDNDPPYDPQREEDEYWAELGFWLSLDPQEQAEYEKTGTLERLQKTAAERSERGAGGPSAKSRAQMWRMVLSLPFEMLGDRPLWITLTYPMSWRRWAPDGRSLEAHRRAFGERWRRNFGEPIGFWTKEFQLAEGRPHLHLLMKAPESMPDADYRGFQERTRQAKYNERVHGRFEGRAKTEPIKAEFGGETAMTLRRWWAEIVTGNTDRRHYVRGVDVRTVFYAYDDAVVVSKRRSAIAAYMAGETAKAKQKIPPDRFGTVGAYYGTWGRAQGFRPQVRPIEVDRAVWDQLNRRLTFLMAWRREAKRTKGHPVGTDWKRRRSWQGITVGGLGPDELARLMAWSVAAAERQRERARCLSPSSGAAS